MTFFSICLLAAMVALLSFLITGVLVWIGRKLGLVDVPNHRSSHASPVPRSGGIGLFIVFTAGGAVLTLFGDLPGNLYLMVTFCSLLIGGIGLIDDYKHVSPLVRLAFHFLACIIAATFLGLAPPQSAPGSSWFEMGFLLIAMVWLLNLYNFMDGIDGIAGTEAVTVALGAALLIWLKAGDIAVAHWLLVLAAAAIGFLGWNWSPAKIFLGDAGSGILGFLFAVIALITIVSGNHTIWEWLILFGVFVIDASVTLATRVMRKQRFYEAHRSHAYQILSRKYKSHAIPVVGMGLINICWLTPWAAASVLHAEYAHLFTLAALGPLLVLTIRVGAGREEI